MAHLQNFALWFSVVLIFSACKRDNDETAVMPGNIPSDTARMAAPGTISTFMNERDFTMTPAMDQLFFTVNEGPAYAIVTLKRKADGWTQPRIVSFNSSYHDIEPFVSPDGSKLFFASDRPVTNQDDSKDFDIWVVEKQGIGWGTPENIGHPVNTHLNEFYPSVAASGNLYFTTHNDMIAMAEFRAGAYKKPRLLPDSVNTGKGEYNAFIDPQERYLLFSSHGWQQDFGRGDLFVSYRKNDESWTTPHCLDGRVNSPRIDMCPYVTPDGRFLFFSSRRKAQNQKIPEVYSGFKERAGHPGNGKLDIYVVAAEGLLDFN